MSNTVQMMKAKTRIGAGVVMMAAMAVFAPIRAASAAGSAECGELPSYVCPGFNPGEPRGAQGPIRGEGDVADAATACGDLPSYVCPASRSFFQAAEPNPMKVAHAGGAQGPLRTEGGEAKSYGANDSSGCGDTPIYLCLIRP